MSDRSGGDGGPGGTDRDRPLLDRFDDLRVADVSDALTYLGRDVHAGYLLDSEIEPVFRDPGRAHRTVGLAFTIRYRATGEPPGPGDLAVVGVDHRPPVGYVGSRLVSALEAAGATGVVTNAGCRDVDELADEVADVARRVLADDEASIEGNEG